VRHLLRILFDPDGFVTGRVYFYAGTALLLLKYCLDSLLVRLFLARTWMPWDYLNIQWRDIDFRDLHVVRFATLMLALALPFIWSGVVLTFKRLRALGWSGASVCFFFIPYLNIAFFLLLAFWPDHTTGESEQGRAPGLERAGFRSAILVVIILTMLSVGLIAFSTQLLEHYGWGLFVGIPFLIGFVPGLLHKTSTRRPLTECILVALAVEIFLAAALLIFAFEGLICLMMAAPLALALTSFGAFIGFTVRKLASWSQPQRDLFCLGAVLIMPLLLVSEKAANVPPALIPVTTAIEISAPAATVWKHVVRFSELPPPTEWIFRLGVAHPLRAEIHGTGPGAVRHCVFSTGPFVEPILIWDEPRLLQFAVTANPRPMQELSFREINPPHLEGFLRSEKGQFALTELSPGKTRLEGTTWYRHGLWPERYWQLWSDYIIHTIHLRVLTHIKREAESPAH
jgi:hypothetical protein